MANQQGSQMYHLEAHKFNNLNHPKCKIKSIKLKMLKFNLKQQVNENPNSKREWQHNPVRLEVWMSQRYTPIGCWESK